MKKSSILWIRLLTLLLAVVLLSGCVPAVKTAEPTPQPVPAEPSLTLITEEPTLILITEEPDLTPVPATPTPSPVTEDGVYDTKDEVALYIHLYGHLPSNYITKKKAGDLGWPGGSLEPYAPGKCIGGGRFMNYEGLLPEAKGRIYYECDIGTMGARSRGARRIIYSNDGLIYYTGDHYESYTLLYGEE